MAKRVEKQQRRKRFEEEKRQKALKKRLTMQFRLFTSLLLLFPALLTSCATFYPSLLAGKDTHIIQLLFLITVLAFANGLGWLLPMMKYQWVQVSGKQRVRLLRLMAIVISSVAWVLMYQQLHHIPVHIIGLVGLLYLCITGLDTEAIYRQTDVIESAQGQI